MAREYNRASCGSTADNRGGVSARFESPILFILGGIGRRGGSRTTFALAYETPLSTSAPDSAPRPSGATRADTTRGYGMSRDNRVAERSPVPDVSTTTRRHLRKYLHGCLWCYPSLGMQSHFAFSAGTGKQNGLTSRWKTPAFSSRSIQTG